MASRKKSDGAKTGKKRSGGKKDKAPNVVVKTARAVGSAIGSAAMEVVQEVAEAAVEGAVEATQKTSTGRAVRKHDTSAPVSKQTAGRASNGKSKTEGNTNEAAKAVIGVSTDMIPFINHQNFFA